MISIIFTILFVNAFLAAADTNLNAVELEEGNTQRRLVLQTWCEFMEQGGCQNTSRLEERNSDALLVKACEELLPLCKPETMKTVAHFDVMLETLKRISDSTNSALTSNNSAGSASSVPGPVCK